MRFSSRATRSRTGKRKYVRKQKRTNRFKALRYVSKGFLNLKRKTNTCYVVPTAIAGVPQAIAGSGVSGSWLTLGTPVAISGSNYDVPFAMEFTMSDIIAYTDITNLADQYKINSVYINIVYNSNVADVNSPASMPGIYYIQDHDDSGVNTVSQTRQRMGLKYKSWGSNRTHVSVGVRPKVAPLIYNGATSGYSVPLTTTWLNCLTPSVPHYGIRGYFTNMYIPSNVDKLNVNLFSFDITYSISAKDFE